jgi:hypothetical protein
LLSFDTRHARQRRRIDRPAAVTMSINNVSGSGTVPFALAEPAAPEPTPRVAPKLARQVLKSAWV